MNILKVNDIAIEQFGYSGSEFLEKSIFELHTENEPDHSEEVVGKMKEEDNGMGIRTKFQQKIFTIFQQLNDDSEFNGSGIGMTDCK